MTKEKESGIEKLIELLNEYVEKHNKSDLYYKFELENGELYCYNDVSDVLWTMQDEAMVICSKQYGFIQWLVENEKIEWEKVYENLKDYEVEIRIRAVKKLQLSSEEKSLWYLELLMLLSIQDEPISFLISILK